MCGIAGLVHLDRQPASGVLLRRMTDAIAHRGPDGEGHWVEGPVAMGHRRLAIIDLTPSGHQPMVSTDHRYVLSYNGEVYNHRELRAELEAEGYLFRSHTDSEVVLNAFAAWGEAALLRFNGMFACALWDRREQRLLLARDRYGIKPLYYAQQGKRMWFASEQKGILADSAFVRRVNEPALVEYFTFQNFFTDATLLRDMRLLPPGHVATVSLAEAAPTLTVREYWDYTFQEPSGFADEREWREELDRLFVQAVERQLMSDVEVGSYLSGGIDSGSITAVAARQLPYMKTFTCGFDLSSASGLELGFDERQRAEAMSYRFKTEHYEMVLKAGDMERCLPTLTWHLEEPRVGQSYPNYYAAKLASRFVKVVLSGAGGDELFGGYPWRYYRAAASTGFDHYIEQYYGYWQRLVDNTHLKAMCRPIAAQVEHVWTRDIFRGVFKERGGALDSPEDYINHSLYFEAKTFLHGLFVVEDKLSMAHGLESRVPFMDNDLVDFAMRCPVRFKLKNFQQTLRINENEIGDKRETHLRRTRDGKHILREVIDRYVPTEISQAEKQGFSAPDASWFKGESMDFVRRRLYGANAPLFSVLDRAAVHDLVDEHLSGRQNRRLLVWSLLAVDEWMRAYL
jgi:asparagine synthase (glutamine-hydrolysing)